jgi:hypothetical protein
MYQFVFASPEVSDDAISKYIGLNTMRLQRRLLLVMTEM